LHTLPLHMHSLRCSWLLALTLAACDPAGPGAAGTISLAPNASTTGFATLEIRFYVDPSGSFDPAGPPPFPSDSSDYPETLTEDLARATFPYHYDLSRSLGTTNVRTWRVTAWLATAATAGWPNGSEPFATTAVPIAACDGFDGYCNTTPGIDLELAPPAMSR